MNTGGDFRKYITFLWNLSTVTTWIKYNMGIGDYPSILTWRRKNGRYGSYTGK